jgi:GntR family transcriptional regulator/MocR family aminotransferase
VRPCVGAGGTAVAGRDRRVPGADGEVGQHLYRAVRAALEREIAHSRTGPRTRLPPSRSLAQELGVSRNTVLTAYQELIAEGFVVSRPRSGLFVNDELLHHGPTPSSPTPASTDIDWETRLPPEPDQSLPEAAKVVDWHRYPYPFVAGQVDARSFPVLAWSRVLREALHEPHLHYSLRDGISDDDPMLVSALCDRILPSRGIEVGPDSVLITLGSQEGLRLLSSALLGPGTVVAVEDPGYLDARHVFVRSGARLLPLTVDAAGVVPPENLSGADVLYLTPSHHHPTNVTLSIGRRHHLLAMADRDDVVIVEDDYDSELRYQGTPSPALKALDTTGRVVYLGTFSKFLAPGLRLGFVVADPPLIAYLRRERRYSVRHAPGHLQRAMALFIESGQYHRAIRRQRTGLRRKWDRMVEGIDRWLPFPVAIPPGGVSIWVPGPPELDALALADELAERGVIIEPGDAYHFEPAAHRNTFRLGFAAIPLERISDGLRIVGGAVADQLGAGTGYGGPRFEQ